MALVDNGTVQLFVRLLPLTVSLVLVCYLILDYPPNVNGPFLESVRDVVLRVLNHG